MGIVSLPANVVGLGGGYPDRIALGSGASRPFGVEGVFEYDGLTLNNRRWIDTYLITSIDGLSDADIRDTREVNPGRHGETAFAAYYGGRTIVLTGRIRAHTILKLRDMQQALRQTFAEIGEEKPLIISTGNALQAVQIHCKKSQPIAMSEVQSDFTHRRDFQLTLRASNPRFVSYVEQRVTWTASGAMTPGAAVAIFTLTNAGNFPAEPIFRIDGPVSAATTGGPAAILRARVDEAGVLTTKTLTINAKAGTTLAVASGNYLEIDTAKRTMVERVVATGALVANAFAQLDVTSDWLELAPGANAIELTVNGSASTPTVVARYRHTYL